MELKFECSDKDLPVFSEGVSECLNKLGYYYDYEEFGIDDVKFVGVEKMKHGFYSKIADSQGLSAIYLNENDEEVKVTYVSDDMNDNFYKFEDKVYVGRVVKCIKPVETRPFVNKLD